MSEFDRVCQCTRINHGCCRPCHQNMTAEDLLCDDCRQRSKHMLQAIGTAEHCCNGLHEEATIWPPVYKDEVTRYMWQPPALPKRLPWRRR